eukprot:TRINITY_DN34722_c0_g1_i1.p1 TRINITY_DN34722_c0_g1~~TRINITY_DN34722_c0_g1_i1.p1  ORF type:complete len:209 (+),score=30.97 TRINITY_DN34722_c0_g1_i1:68-694(+)
MLRRLTKRHVMSIPKHILGDRIKAGEYKIGRIRLAYTLEEAKEVIEFYEQEGCLDLPELNVMLHKCADARCREFGLWTVEVMERNHERDFKVWEYNNIFYLYYKIWEPDRALDTFLKMSSPTNESYSNLLRLCVDGLQRSVTRSDTMKFKRIGHAAIEHVENNCDVIDGRFHLLRAIRLFYSTIRDYENEDRYTALVTEHSARFQGGR